MSAPKRRKVKFNNRKHPKQKWFNSECELLRKQYMYTKKQLYLQKRNKVDTKIQMKRCFSI